CDNGVALRQRASSIGFLIEYILYRRVTPYRLFSSGIKCAMVRTDREAFSLYVMCKSSENAC
ncbi:hypothetical protein CEXT_599971, partial [Caerostris extrusa]